MRYLYFDEEAGLKSPKDVYEMVYDGLMNSPKGYEGPAENRMVTKVFDKLEAIGVPAERNGKSSFDLHPRCDVPLFVALEDAEYTLVWETLKVIRWTGQFSRKAAELYDWLEKAPGEVRQPTAQETPAKELAPT